LDFGPAIKICQKGAKVEMTPELTSFRLGIWPSECQRKLGEMSSFCDAGNRQLNWHMPPFDRTVTAI
jgi:hypothetical protein